MFSNVIHEDGSREDYIFVEGTVMTHALKLTTDLLLYGALQ